MIGEDAGSSFRDPSGFIFFREGRPYRQVNAVYGDEYDFFIGSGLYDHLTEAGLLVAHEEVSTRLAASGDAHRVLLPDLIRFISYPYEWSFLQLRDAALLTLDVHRRALEHGMSLKDASAFNIQFRGCSPVFIDTLSFERYEEGRPWVAYRQFCQHFLAPLCLMARVDPRLVRLFATELDGVPLDLASKLLPRSTRFRLSQLLHIHLHARSIARYGGRGIDSGKLERGMSRKSMEALISNLESATRRLSWKPKGTEWAAYEDEHGYGEAGLEAKKRQTAELLDKVEAVTVWDLGSNTGMFSRLAAERAELVVSIDGDPAAVDLNYRAGRQRGEQRVLPLFMDLSNPSPSLGWDHRERSSLRKRGPADVVLALALLHHLAISNNTPFRMMADWLAGLGKMLIIEFVPKEDPQAQRLLVSREDIFRFYDISSFEASFSERFDILQRSEIEGTDRTLYLMAARDVGAG